MLKLLVPVDGSANSDRVIDHLIRDRTPGEVTELHLLNVQIPVDSGHARMFFSSGDVEAYHREEGQRALKIAREKLDAAGMTYTWHVAVGPVAGTIVGFAHEHACDRIVMGEHGSSALTHLLLGSVASEVSRSASVPVILVK